MNLLGSLASKAAADADELLRESEHIPAYLLDSEGEFVVDDPADPVAREQVLYEALLDAENQHLFDELGEEYYEPELAEARYRYRYYRRPRFGRRRFRRRRRYRYRRPMYYR